MLPGRIAAALRGVARGLATATLLASAAGASAAEAGAPASPRDRVRADRAQAEAQYAEAERACRARFAISGCLEAAGAKRREALTRLRRQDVEIDAAERRERAAARRARIEAKTGAAPVSAAAGPAGELLPPEPRRRGASGAAETGASAVGDSVSSGVPATPRKAPRPAASLHVPKPPRLPRPGVERSAQEAAERAAFERKQQQAAAHRAEVERRNADAAKSGRPAAPLPGPAASAR